MQKSWYKTWWGIILIIIIILSLSFLAALGFYFVNALNLAQKNQTELSYLNGLTEAYNVLDASTKKTIEGDKNYWLGSPNPKVTIVEFADFNCPVCRQAYSTIREISLNNKDVKIIFRDYPVISENSLALALAARCAGEQGLFWPMHDKLFQNQGITKSEELTRLAEQVGAELNRFGECMTQKKYLPQIQVDASDADKLGIKGTPGWLVNGFPLSGNVPLETFSQIINELSK